MSLDFTIIGENIHTTRILMRNGKRIVEDDNGEEVVSYKDLDGNADEAEFDEDDDGTIDIIAYDFNQDGEWDKFKEVG